MPDRDFNILQIGCGYWGSNLAKTFNSHGYLSHLCDQDYSSALMLAKEINNSLSVVPLEDYLSIEGLDAVSIATPAETHFEIAKNCLFKRINILVEKPLTLDLSEALFLKKLSLEMNTLLMTEFTQVFNPKFQKMQKSLGLIGDIKFITFLWI